MDQGIAHRTRGKVAAAEQRQKQQEVFTDGVTRAEVDQILTQDQSIRVIQTALLSSVSPQNVLPVNLVEQCLDLLNCLYTLLSGLFKSNYFDEIYINSGTIHQTFDDFAAGKLPKLPQQASLPSSRVPSREKGAKVYILQRDRSSKVDILLDTLAGVFDTLRRRWLKALQLIVSAQPGKPLHALEVYTFTFHYALEGNDKRTTMSWDLHGPNAEPVSMEPDMKKVCNDQQHFLRRLISLCDTLPELPERRYLDMIIHYTDDCDQTYEPPCFKPCVHEEDGWVLFPESGGWYRASQVAGRLGTGSHLLNVFLSHMNPPKSLSLQDRIPQDLQHTVKVSLEDEIAASERPSQPPPSRVNGATSFTTRSQSIANHDKDSKNTAQFTETQVKGSQVSVSQVHMSQLETQLSEDIRRRDILQELLHPNEVDSSVKDTQLDNVRNSQLDGGRVPKPPKMHLKKASASELARKQTIIHGSKGKPGLLQTRACVEVVDCQCRWNYEEFEMIECHFCKSWQHLVCYGLQTAKDPRMPEIHACYKCLLSGKEPLILENLENLALLRKGMYIIQTEGYENERKLSKALHCDIKVALSVAEHLRKEGFVVPNPREGKRLSKSKSVARFTAVEEGAKYQEMLRKYFDPLTHIGHHYEPASNMQPWIETQNFISAGSVEMLPDIPAARPRVSGGRTTEDGPAKAFHAWIESRNSMPPPSMIPIIDPPLVPETPPRQTSAQNSSAVGGGDDLYQQPTPKLRKRKIDAVVDSPACRQRWARKKARFSKAAVQLNFQSSPLS